MAENERETKIISNVIKTQAWLATRRSRYEDTWEEIGREISPLRADIRQTEPQGERRWDDIYDSTAQTSLDIHVNGIFGNFATPDKPWFKLGMKNSELNDIRDVRVYLQEVEESMFAVLSDSNFYDELLLMIQDGATIGTAPFYIEEDFESGGIVAMAIHPGESYLSHNDKNIVDVFHRKITFTLKQIISKFGDSVPADIIEDAEQNPFAERIVIHAVYKREDYDPFKFDSINKPFASLWILTGQVNNTGTQDSKTFQGQSNKKGVKSEDVILKESGFDTMPYMVWRPYRDTREEYGRSPSMRALPDAMALNIIGKTLLGVAERAAEPPAITDPSQEGVADFGARGINFIANGETPPSFLEMAREYPVSRDREAAKQQAVRETYSVDFFIALNASQGQQTATEATLKEGEKVVILMSSITRLQGVTSAALGRVFQIENDAGRMPVPPEILQEGDNVKISFLGPLAQVQSRLFQTRGINETIFDLGGVVQLFGAEPLRNFDSDIVVREIAEGNIFPAKGIRPLKEVQEERAQDAAIAAEQEQADKLALQAETAGKLAKADKDSDGAITEAMAAAAGEGG